MNDHQIHTFTKTPVRFFILDENLEIQQSPEHEFQAAINTGDYTISYERHTVRENGVSQICLTATPKWI